MAAHTVEHDNEEEEEKTIPIHFGLCFVENHVTVKMKTERHKKKIRWNFMKEIWCAIQDKAKKNGA